jgi:inhibitor of cysteine peptidase
MNALDRRQLLRISGLLVAAAGLAPAASAQAEETAETIRLLVGGARTIGLTENPSTGYRWSLNQAASRNLALIAIADAGFASRTQGKRIVGAPGTRRFRVTARSPGTALAVFDYSRPWERVAPARRHSVTIEIGGR